MLEFSQIIRIDEGNDAQTVINTLNKLVQTNKYVFRGYNKQDELFPTIIREKTKFDDCESELLSNFERFGSHYFHANTPMDFLSCAQHFGLPTRLLDFTYNPFIALSFALYGQKSSGNYKEPHDKEYYYILFASTTDNIVINTIPLSNDIYHTEITRSDSLAVRSCQSIDYITALFSNHTNGLNKPLGLTLGNSFEIMEKIKRRTILFVDPNQSNQRIIMQQGLFMFPYTLNNAEHQTIIQNNSSLIMIHKSLRNDLLEYLETLGFNAFRLMPDLASICEAVKRKVLDDRNAKNILFKKKA